MKNTEMLLKHGFIYCKTMEKFYKMFKGDILRFTSTELMSWCHIKTLTS